MIDEFCDVQPDKGRTPDTAERYYSTIFCLIQKLFMQVNYIFLLVTAKMCMRDIWMSVEQGMRGALQSPK
jgi:hypothetical protein